MKKLSPSECAAQCKVIRRHIIEMLCAAGSGHPGGSLSATELVTAIYFHFLNQDPAQPEAPDRDRFILSKGHGVPVQYACMAERGYFPVSELATLRKIDSRLQGHPVKGALPGIEASTGALGQGLSIACGHALAGQLDGAAFRVYCLLGDGEINEGQVWEAALFAAHRRLDNLIAIVDANALQLDGRCTEILNIEPLAAKWTAFGWHVIELDGHDLPAIYAALEEALAHRGQPTCLVARTVKGKGVSFMENQVEWHGVAPTAEQARQALAEIG
ncbi:MAG: transketolase [Fimbriimonadaceae bacterium]|nr:transketolase [Fimbriimonadaceae bacterium]